MMAKKTVLGLVVLAILAGLFMYGFLSQPTVDIYIDGETVSVHSDAFLNTNLHSMDQKICDYTLDAMNDTTSNITTLKIGIQDICHGYGIENPTINVNSVIGKDQIPIIMYVSGTSMVPTLQDGQTVLVNKTHNIHVGDIVVAQSDEYGGIIKRVEEIDGNQIYLVSDNKDVEYVYENGSLYEVKGVTTWVDLSNISGVVIEY